MRITVAIYHYDGPNGAATYAHTLSRHLQRLGHEVRISTPDAGAMAEVSRAVGIPVDDEHADRPDAIVAQDAMIAYALAERWPDVPQVFVAHGAYRDENMPPQDSGFTRATVAMNERVASRVRALAHPVELVRLRQPVDVELFRPRGAVREQPRRALLLGGHLRGQTREHIVAALDLNGIEVLQIGQHGTVSMQPERAIREADIVIGYGRSALEGMASGVPTYIYDHRGGDGWVTEQSYAALEANGFAGTASEQALDVERLAADLRAYDPGAGRAGRKLVACHHDAFHHATDMSMLLKRVADPDHVQPSAAAELARLSRLQWESEWRAGTLLEEVVDVNERLRAAESLAESLRGSLREREAREGQLVARLHAAEGDIATLHREREAFRATRRFRLAAALARPLDGLRRAPRGAPERRPASDDAPRPPRIIALVAFRDELRHLPDFFANVAPHVDGIIALDDQSVDGSAELVAAQPSVLELLTVAPGAQDELEDGRNHRALTEAAWRHGADWLLGLDADERLEQDFRRRAEREIISLQAGGADAAWLHFRELWDRPDQYRADGIWATKRKACLFRSSPDHRFDDRRVHAHWASVPPPPGDWPQADLTIYHLRMLQPADRAPRRERYRRIDPDNIWQPIGYDYLLDDTGLTLEPIAPERAFTPWPAGRSSRFYATSQTGDP